jgi:hypothetical protein
MVLAVATAAGGKLRIVGSGGEGWRDQREAEEEQQQNGGRASHENIVQETAAIKRRKPDYGAVE